MVPDTHAEPQFRAESTGEDTAAPVFIAEHGDEVMRRLRHPFDPDAATRRGTATAGSIVVTS